METRQPAWFSYLQVLFRWRKFYLITLSGVFVVACIVSLLLPKWYQSSATILPPTTTAGFEALIPEEIRGFFGGTMGQNAEANMYLAILNSRSLREEMIKKLDLATVYRFQGDYHIEDLLTALDNNIEIVFDGENPLSISVTDRSPERAAEMANFMVDELDRMYQQINNRQAAFNRVFLEKRVAETRAALSVYEDSLKNFQERNQAISLPDQATATIKVASDLIAQMMNIDIQIQVLKNTVQPDHPSLRALTEQRRGIEEQIRKLTKSSPDSGEPTPFPGFDQLPDLIMQYARLYREVEIQSKLLEFLIPQYEQARIQEVKDTPTVTKLDKGRVPTKRIKPKRKIMVITTLFLSFIVCTAIVFTSEYFRRIKGTDHPTYRGLIDMAENLKKTIPFSKRG